MSRQFLVPILLPADPTVALEAATKQYVDLTGGGTGDQYRYDWLTATTASDPGTGKAKCNNADPSLATAVYISMYDDLGAAGIFLLDLEVGSRFAFYEQGDINTFIRYQVSSTLTNNGPNVWFSIPVTVDEEGTSGFTPSNNQTVQVGPSRGSAISVANTDLADMATNTIKGRVTAGTGDPQDLTPAQARTVIASDAGGTANFFRADGTFAAPPTGEGEPAVGTKMTDLTAQTAGGLATADIIETVDLSDTTMAASGTNKKLTWADTITFLAANGLGSVRKYSTNFGDGSATSFVITHNLNTLDVQVYVYENGGTKRMTLVEVQHTSVNSVTLAMYPAPTSNEYRVVVMG